MMKRLIRAELKKLKRQKIVFVWISQHTLFVYHYFCAANAD